MTKGCDAYRWYTEPLILIMTAVMTVLICLGVYGISQTFKQVDACEKAGGVVVGRYQQCIKKDSVIYP